MLTTTCVHTYFYALLHAHTLQDNYCTELYTCHGKGSYVCSIHVCIQTFDILFANSKQATAVLYILCEIALFYSLLVCIVCFDSTVAVNGLLMPLLLPS